MIQDGDICISCSWCKHRSAAAGLGPILGSHNIDSNPSIGSFISLCVQWVCVFRSVPTQQSHVQNVLSALKSVLVSAVRPFLSTSKALCTLNIKVLLTQLSSNQPEHTTSDRAQQRTSHAAYGLSGLGTSLIVGVIDSSLGLPHIPVSAPLHNQQRISMPCCLCSTDT